MRETSNFDETTRRAILRGASGALGVAAFGGVASAHPGAGDHGKEDHDHPAEDSGGVTPVGYHSLGQTVAEGDYGSGAGYPHHGGISEMKVDADRGLAYVGILSSKSPTNDRGMAILDVTDYTRAESKADLDDAEMKVLSFLPNENNTTSVMDVKLSDDGNYAFICKQPIAVLFGDEEAQTDPENVGSSPESGSLQAVDVSDPWNPTVVGRWDGWGVGPHNSDHLRIDGTDYVFAVKGPAGAPAAIYVVLFDRTTGAMSLVNYWTHDTQLTQGQVKEPTDETYANGNQYYAHDITVEYDPQSDTPLAYLANWNSGARVLDVTDPLAIREIGHFEMNRCHEIEPATVTDGDGSQRRVFVAGQENPDSDYGQGDNHETGYVYVVDCQDLFENDFAQGEAGNLGTASNLVEEGESPETELGKWLLARGTKFDNYTLSAHNLDIFEADVKNETRQFVALGHYHAGVRILEFSEALGGYEPKYTDCGLREATDESGVLPYNGDDGLGQVASFRNHVEGVADDAKMAGLTAATPDFWCGVEANGVIFTSGINTGVYAFTVDPDRGKPNDDGCHAPQAPDIPVGSDGEE